MPEPAHKKSGNTLLLIGGAGLLIVLFLFSQGGKKQTASGSSSAVAAPPLMQGNAYGSAPTIQNYNQATATATSHPGHWTRGPIAGPVPVSPPVTSSAAPVTPAPVTSSAAPQTALPLEWSTAKGPGGGYPGQVSGPNAPGSINLTNAYLGTDVLVLTSNPSLPGGYGLVESKWGAAQGTPVGYYMGHAIYSASGHAPSASLLQSYGITQLSANPTANPGLLPPGNGNSLALPPIRSNRMSGR